MATINRLMRKHRPSLKDVNVRTLPRTKYDRNDPEEKQYLKELIEDIERKEREMSEVKRMRKWDFSTTLPLPLYKRVAKLIPLDPIEQDVFTEDMRLVENSKRQEEKKLEEELRVDTQVSDILDKEDNEYKPIEVKPDKQHKFGRHKPKKTTWFSEYIDKPKKDRIVWKSKLYNMEKTLLEKPLFEQAEESLDNAAQQFAEWLNSLGSDEKTNVDKEEIKGLFSMGIEEAIASTVQAEMKNLPALPNDMAVKWKIPEKSLDNKVEECLKKLEGTYPRRISIMQLDRRSSKSEGRDKRKQRQKIEEEPKVDSKKKISWKKKAEMNVKRMMAEREARPKSVAFGRTLPSKMRQWIPSEVDKPLEPDFPEDIITTECLFKGIEHLRSTKALIEHYLQNPKLERPTYLIKCGAFKPTPKRPSSDVAPLYERLLIHK